jgi:hypothetical protein
VQLASLMPTPIAASASPALLQQFKPPALPLESVTFQMMFGAKLQKQLDHYLTYVRSLVSGRHLGAYHCTFFQPPTPYR